MIFLFTGDDTKNKYVAYEKFLKSIPPAEERFSISRNNFDKTYVENLYSGSGLFFKKCTVVFSGILDNEDTRDFVMEKLESFGKSGNTFIFLEGKLSKPILDAFKKNGKGAEVYSFELPKEKKEKFDGFLLANAFGSKEKLNLWVYFRQAMGKGVMIDELSGILFWKIKDMILKRDFRNFKEVELQNQAMRLSRLLPESRKEGIDVEAAFERFLLETF